MSVNRQYVGSPIFYRRHNGHVYSVFPLDIHMIMSDGNWKTNASFLFRMTRLCTLTGPWKSPKDSDHLHRCVRWKTFTRSVSGSIVHNNMGLSCLMEVQWTCQTGILGDHWIQYPPNTMDMEGSGLVGVRVFCRFSAIISKIKKYWKLILNERQRNFTNS